MMFKPDIWNRSVKISVAVTVVLVFFIWLSPPQRETGHRFKSWVASSLGQSHSGSPHGHHEPASTDDDCLRLPLGDDVVVTVKTGASEAAARIPMQLATSLRCAKNVLLFSDMEQTLDNHTLHDALSTIPESVKSENADFDLYRKQQARKTLGWHDDPITEETKQAAWNLDKYKNLHIVSKSWWLLPNKKWYLHIDADTYLVWPSLLWWLDKIRTDEALYTGSLTCFAEVKAAHGGSGILLNGLATQAMVVDNRSTIPKYDAEASGHCCGDELVARALNDNGITMHNSWPIINGENPFTIPYGPLSWCEPIVTMHHVSTAQMEMIGKFERRRANRSEPLTYAELFTDLVADVIPERLDDWDNAADDITIPSCPSFDECIRVCNENEKCFQSVYDGSECVLGTKSFKLGEEKLPEDGKRWQSQWNKERMLAWAAEHTNCSNLSLAFKDAFVCGGHRPDE